MSRPKEEEKIQINIKLNKSKVEEIEKLAKRLKLSRSKMIKNLIDSGLDDAKIIDRLKGFELFMAGGKIVEMMKEKFYKGEVKLEEEGELKVKL